MGGFVNFNEGISGVTKSLKDIFDRMEDGIANGEYPCPPPPDPAEEAAEIGRARVSRLKGMNLGKVYWDKDFDSFDAFSPELKGHLETARRFAANPTGKLVMLGGNGTGKNHLAAAILKYVGGVIYTAYEIGVNLRHSYGGHTREKDVLDGLCYARLLVIDEIGRSKGQESDLNWLSHVINKRHEAMLPLVLISNRHMQADCTGGKDCRKCLENFVDDDVISRIVEDGEIMKFTGGDYREKIRRQRQGGQG